MTDGLKQDIAVYIELEGEAEFFCGGFAHQHSAEEDLEIVDY